MTERFLAIAVEKIGPVARLTLSRPERANALNAAMLSEIGTALDEIERDSGVRVLIVAGAGTAFSSGFDLKEQMERRPVGVETWRPILRKDFDTIMRFWHFPRPTIATVRGPCLAGACELALACDITIASEDAFFGEPELKFGAGIVAMILPWVVGPKIAKEIILLGQDRIPAARAREIGMVNRVVASDELEGVALAIANHIAAVDPKLVKETKRAINRAFEAQNMLEALEEGLAIDLAIEGAGSPDKLQFMELARRDGLKAALAWRDARFPGLHDMIGILAESLDDALRSLGHSVESTSGERQEPSALLALADRVGRALTGRGVAQNEPVHVRIGNRASDLGALLGVWQAGAVVVPVHALAAPSTIERVQRASRARFSIDGDRLDVLGHLAPPNRALLGDAALVIFTSGSTGEPKGVVIGHRRFADKLAILDRLLKIRSNDVVLSPLQLTFIFGLWVSLLALMKGARLMLAPKFTSDAIGRSLVESTVLAGVPSMFRALLTGSAVKAPNLRLILTGGEVLAPGLAHAMTRLAPGAIHDLYGLTETGSCDFCLSPAHQPHGFGTIGYPTDRVAFRLARDGRAVAAGETGELQIRTPFGMLGYLDNPELTDASFDGDYFRTGDLARMTASGYVELVGRAKDIISRGGNKIAPLEIDNLLGEHPDVAAALCAGVPDERLGEVIHAVIVPRAGAAIDAVALRDWLLARTERFKVPDVFHFCDVLPSGSSGKADRRAIAQLAAQAT